MTDFLKEQLMQKIDMVDFPKDQYYRAKTEKYQIYLHHTVSPGHSAKGDINYWLSTKSRIATHVIIDQNGQIWQCFSSKYWAHHLGIKTEVFQKLNLESLNLYLNKHSLSIELDSLGPLHADGSSKAYGSRCRQHGGIVEYTDKYRGFQYFERYTDAQLESLQMLLKYWSGVYEIDTTYRDEMWDVSKIALSGKSGIWTHTSVRPDKSDCHPQEELIQILKSL